MIIRGTVEMVKDATEKMKALEHILDKYSPADKVMGIKYAEKSFSRTAILRLTIKTASGKCKK